MVSAHAASRTRSLRNRKRLGRQEQPRRGEHTNPEQPHVESPAVHVGRQRPLEPRSRAGDVAIDRAAGEQPRIEIGHVGKPVKIAGPLRRFAAKGHAAQSQAASVKHAKRKMTNDQ